MKPQVEDRIGAEAQPTSRRERLRLIALRARLALAGFLAVLLAGLWLPAETRIPVSGARAYDWNPETFWYEPWGASVVHKGIDIFGARGTSVFAPSPGLVIFTGNVKLGGNVVAVLSSKWRIHYLAHFEQVEAKMFDAVGHDDRLGTLGDSGNAFGKQPHIHYSVISLIPYPWLATGETQGWKKMFYLNPDELLEAR